MVTCGTTAGVEATTNLQKIFWHQLTIIGSTMGNMHEFRQAVSLFKSGSLKPTIDTVFTPEESREAWGRLEAGEQFGKIVLDWSRFRHSLQEPTHVIIQINIILEQPPHPGGSA